MYSLFVAYTNLGYALTELCNSILQKQKIKSETSNFGIKTKQQRQWQLNTTTKTE